MNSASGGPAKPKSDKPSYWELLSEADQKTYLAIREEILANNNKRVRNGRVESFDSALEVIKSFINKGDEDDWKRSLVCGICWMDDSLAVNTRQLRMLISKCKSSINGSLQKMGYSTNTAHTESWKILFPKIPCLKENFNELRQWTIRSKISSDKIPRASPSSSPKATELPQTHSSATKAAIYPIKFMHKLGKQVPI